jgi:ribosomal protein S18 acetylase RimI-like enzyme
VEKKVVLGLRAPDGGLLGAVDVIREFPHEHTWYIGELILAPHARGLGLGYALYLTVEEQARAAGAHQIDLAVHEANGAALAFWSSMGFHETGRSQYRIKTRESTFSDMRKQLRTAQA